jgi:hypothetical protein
MGLTARRPRARVAECSGGSGSDSTFGAADQKRIFAGKARRMAPDH